MAKIALENTAVESIGAGAFRNTEIQKIIIPDTCKEIGTAAFSDCFQLKSVVWPKSCNTISHSCFSNCCRLNKFLPDFNHIFSIDEFAFANTEALKRINLSNSIAQNIKTGAFLGKSPKEVIPPYFISVDDFSKVFEQGDFLPF